MLKKTITYTDYNDVERTEDFYFNITKAEAMEMEFSVEGGLTAMIDKITAAKDFTSLVSLFKEFILLQDKVPSQLTLKSSPIFNGVVLLLLSIIIVLDVSSALVPFNIILYPLIIPLDKSIFNPEPWD